MRARALAFVAAVAAAGCNQALGLDPVVGKDGGETRDGGDDRDSGAIDARLPTDWSTPRLVAQVRSDKTDEDPAMSSDGLELYLAVKPLSGAHDIVRYVRTSTAMEWTYEPTIAAINSTATDWTPRLSADDRTLYFTSDRADGNGGGVDVWFSTRTGTTAASVWSTPTPLVTPAINSPFEDRSATPCRGGRFVFTRPRNGSLDLFEIEADGVVATPIPGASDPDYVESAPFISEDCLTLYFSSAEFGDPDVMVMTRTSVGSPWTTPQPIPNLSTENLEGDPWVSADGRYMLLAIDILPVDGDFDIYESFR